MKKMILKTLSLLFVFMLICSVALADTENLTESMLTYEVNEDGKTCTITGIRSISPWYSYFKSVSLNIPEKMGGKYKVTAIGGGAFINDKKIAHVTIPSSVESIGINAFAYCGKLSSVNVSSNSNLKTIGRSAFINTKISKFIIPDNVTEIGASAFEGCDNITLTVSENNKTYAVIDRVLFNKIEKALVWYPDYLEAETYVVPDGIKKIENCAFVHSRVKEIVIPKTVETIDGNEKLKGCFTECSQLKKITIEEGSKLKSSAWIGNCRELSSLESVTIPDGIRIPEGLFKETKWPASALKFSEDNTRYQVIDGALYDVVDNVLLWFSESNADKVCTVKDGTVKIGAYAFCQCDKLEEVQLPETVTEIGDHAFNYCKNLCNVNIPNSVTKIGNNVFYESPKVCVTIDNNKYAEKYCQEKGISIVTTKMPDWLTE